MVESSVKERIHTETVLGICTVLDIVAPRGDVAGFKQMAMADACNTASAFVTTEDGIMKELLVDALAGNYRALGAFWQVAEVNGGRFLNGLVTQVGNDFLALVGQLLRVVEEFVPDRFVHLAGVAKADDAFGSKYGVEASKVADFEVQRGRCTVKQLCIFLHEGMPCATVLERNLAVNVEGYDGLFSCPVCHKLFLLDKLVLTVGYRWLDHCSHFPIIPISPIKVTQPVLLAPVATGCGHLLFDTAIGEKLGLVLLQKLF